MATPPQANLNAAQPSQPAQAQEATPDNPVRSGKNKTWTFNGVTITQDDAKVLVQKATELRQGWAPQRLRILSRVLEAYEFFRGNQYFGQIPGSFEMFDAFEQYASWRSQSTGGQEDEDLSLVQLATNFIQMLCFSFIAALSADIPKTEAVPENAEQPEDRETAKAATTVQTIISQRNKSKTLHKQKLWQLWNSGCYFEFTRYVVDSDLFKTHKETVLQGVVQQVLPDRYICSNCGASTPLAAMRGKDVAHCPTCRAPLEESNFYPAHTDTIPIAGKEDVPNGMVWQSIFGPLHVDAKPEARTLRDTPILALEMEVAKGWLRSSFPDFYDDIQDGIGADSDQGQYARQARRISYAEQGQNYSYSLYNDPTYTRTWIPLQTFFELDDQKTAQKFAQAFPNGVKISHLGELVLNLEQDAISDRWTWCGTIPEEYGLFPPGAGDPAIPLQKRYNNLSALVDAFMERCALGLVLANGYYVDTKALNKSPLLPGRLCPIALNNGQAITDIQKILHQFEFQIEPKIMEWIAAVPGTMQQLVGTPPQVWGGPGDPNVQTAKGQAQQLGTARGKLNHYWDLIREQEAEAMEQAVECAGKNMTESWWNTVTDRTKEFRNEWVHPEQMRGSVHVQEATDQGFPISPEDMQAFWEKILGSPNNVLAAVLFQEPKNVDAAIRSFGIPGLTTTDSRIEALAMYYIAQLMAGRVTVEQVPVMDNTGNPAIDPRTGQPQTRPVDVPSVQPIKEMYHLDRLAEAIRTWSEEHYDQTSANPTGLRNVLAFFKLCVEWAMQNKQAMAANIPQPPAQGHPPRNAAQKPQAVQ